MPKTFIYSYRDGAKPDLEIDLSEKLSIKEGDLIVRRELTWKVETVHLEREKDSTTVWVLLVEPPVN